ncbi:MAG: hypothetical protein MUC67_09365 [Acidobacteria bacterium]|nr:hypothetical protein [Acidobacteriota bacterium]
MQTPGIFTADEAAFLRELAQGGVRFMVVGLAAATLQGAPAVTQDVDLWFRDLSDPRIARALRAVGGAYVPPIGANPPLFAGQAVELFDIVVAMHGLRSFDEEYAGALPVPLGDVEVMVLPLDRILTSKKALDRPKDRLVIPVLEDALAVIEERKAGAPNRRPARKRPHR